VGVGTSIQVVAGLTGTALIAVGIVDVTRLAV
jgi:hypothetical protein